MNVDLQHYRAIWPILPPQQPMAELMDEAWPDLGALITRGRLTLAGRPRWCIRPGSDVPGSGGAAHVLIADCVVARIPANVDALTGDTDRTWGEYVAARAAS